MSDVTLSLGQQRVVEHKGTDLLVSASAGAGKTFVLLKRIMVLLQQKEDPAGLDEMLILTFTNAAAIQLREKMEEQLLEILEKNPDPYLEQQYKLLPVADINTNHAFCLKILKRYVAKIEGLDPNFKILDEIRKELLKSQALSEVIEALYTEALEKEPSADSRHFLAFMDNYSSEKREENIEELIFRIYHFLISNPDPLDWLHRSVAAFDPDAEAFDTRWVSDQDSVVMDLLPELLGLLELACKLYAPYRSEQKAGVLLGKLQSIHHDLASFVEADASIKEIADYIEILSIPNFTYDCFSEEEAALVKKVRSAISTAKSGISKRKQSLIQTEEQIGMVRRIGYPALLGLEVLITRFHHHFMEMKKSKAMLDFNDLEHYCLEILSYPEIQREYQGQYRYIFVDEYQDTNPLQEAIIQKITRKDALGRSVNLFMVGDIKQSIYAFRHANPDLFAEKQKNFSHHDGGELIHLAENYRTQQGVLDMVNYFFEHLMTKRTGKLIYSKDDDWLRSFSGIQYPLIPPVLRVLKAEEKTSAQDRLHLEAMEAAKIVEGLLEEGYQKKEIVILLRDMKGVGVAFSNALSMIGIPNYCESQTDFFDTIEIRTVVNLLSVIDNPRQDIPLVGVLFSPIFAFTPEELSQIRLAKREGRLYDALLFYCEKGAKEELKKKILDFATKVKGWRRKAARLSMHTFLWQLYEESQLYLYFLQQEYHERAKANLDLLLDRAKTFEQGIYNGVYAFLKYVNMLSETAKSEDEAKLFSEDQDVVRIMTIHKSKGLEFGAVILGQLGKSYRFKDAEGSIIFHKDAGIGLTLVDGRQKLKADHPSHIAVAEAIKQGVREEELRLLYVAMTRAKRQLYMLGTVSESLLDEYKNGDTYLSKLTGVMRSYPPEEGLFSYEERGLSKEEIASRLADYERGAFSPFSGAALDEEIPCELSEFIDKMEYFQKHPLGSEVPKSFSVSAIKAIHKNAFKDDLEQADERNLFTLPKSIEGEAFGPEAGSAFHEFVCHLPLTDETRRSSFETLSKGLLSQGMLTQEEAALIVPKWAEDFLSSEHFDALLHAKTVFREQPFVLRLSKEEMEELGIYEQVLALSHVSASDPQSPNSMQVQGIIDCFYEREDGWVLVDYKTDRYLSRDSLESYSTQLRIYEKAIEKALGKKIIQKQLYVVRHGKILIL